MGGRTWSAQRLACAASAVVGAFVAAVWVAVALVVVAAVWASGRLVVKVASTVLVVVADIRCT